MNKTEELQYFKRKSPRQPCVRTNVFHRGGPPVLEPFEAHVETAKQIIIQGQCLSSRDFVQSNWGRVQAAAADEYARAFLVSDLPAEFGDLIPSFTDRSVSSHHGSIGIVQEPQNSRGRDASVLKEQLAEIVSTYDDASIRAIIAKLSEASGNHAKLHVVKEWLDDFENRERSVEPPIEESFSQAIVLERLEGFVDQIEGSTALVRLKSEHGEELYGEYPAADLLAKGIMERRRFRCETIERDGHVHVSLEAIPERQAPDEEDAIHRRIDELLADDELDGDY